MKNLFQPKFVFLCLVFVFSANFANAGCNSALRGNQYDQRVNGSRLDQTAFSNAVLHYTNQIRCRRGLRQFTSANDVYGAAVVHGRNMARTRTYSHDVRVRGARNLRERMRGQNASFSAAAENIAKTFVYYLNGRGFINDGNCNFRYTANRQPIPVHTYRTLAQELVESWYNSPGHRENILSRRLTRMGAGLGIVKNTSLCGEIYASQVFAG